MTRRARIALFVTFSLIIVGGAFLLPRIPQPLAYHHFADQHPILGVPNAFDVLSNFGFLVVGLLGLLWLRRWQAKPTSAFLNESERWPYLIFFLGVTLTAFGSAYYHLAPDNARLVWDRLPMTIAFTAFLAALLSERIGVEVGSGLLLPLVAIGAASVFYWIWTEQRGTGDLRFYGLVQAYPFLALILLLILFPPRYTGGKSLLIALAWYVLAKVCELYDRQIFDATRVLSGHTIKHLSAAIGTLVILQMLRNRQPAELKAAPQQSF
jgi:hypothetical protein